MFDFEEEKEVDRLFWGARKGAELRCGRLYCASQGSLCLSARGLSPHLQGSSRRFPSPTSCFPYIVTQDAPGQREEAQACHGLWWEPGIPSVCTHGPSCAMVEGGKQMLLLKPQCPAPSPNSGPPASQTKVGGWRRCSASASLAPRGMWAARRAPANEHLPSFHYVSCATCAPALSGRPRGVGEVPWLLVGRVCRK